jgi:hypothetical protein
MVQSQGLPVDNQYEIINLVHRCFKYLCIKFSQLLFFSYISGCYHYIVDFHFFPFINNYYCSTFTC